MNTIRSPYRMSNIELKARALAVLSQEYQNNSRFQTANSLLVKIKVKTVSHVRMKRILEECISEGTVEKQDAGGNKIYSISETGLRNISHIINAFKALGCSIE